MTVTVVDAVAGALPAWRFTQFGDIDLSQFTDVPWVVEVDGRVLSNRPPGVSWVAVPVSYSSYSAFSSSAFCVSVL